MPPHRNLKTPIIKQNLLGGETKKSDPNCLKASALETIDQYSREWIHIYTDGSAFKATINAGYGAIIHHPKGEKEEIYSPCGSFCSNFVAEKEAIIEALKHVTNSFEKAPNKVKDVVIFTDSLSALQELENGKMSCKYISQISIACDNLINKYDIKVALQWIPGH